MEQIPTLKGRILYFTSPEYRQQIDSYVLKIQEANKTVEKSKETVELFYSFLKRNREWDKWHRVKSYFERVFDIYGNLGNKSLDLYPSKVGMRTLKELRKKVKKPGTNAEQNTQYINSIIHKALALTKPHWVQIKIILEWDLPELSIESVSEKLIDICFLPYREALQEIAKNENQIRLIQASFRKKNEIKSVVKQPVDEE